MKNITITLDERAAEWVRLHAARQNMSVSRLVGQMLEARMRESRAYDSAMRRFLAREPVALKKPRGRYPARDSLHERE